MPNPSPFSSRAFHKYKAACDQCHARKVKCPGEGPPCRQCVNGSHTCHYSLASRTGKPPGTKNRKTLERLRQTQEGNPKCNGEGRDIDEVGQTSIAANNCGRDEANQASNPENQHQDGNSPNPMSSPSTFQLVSPLMNHLSPINPSYSLLHPEQGILDADHTEFLDEGDEAIFRSGDLQFSNFDGLENANLQRSWIDALGDGLDVSMPLCSAPMIIDWSISPQPAADNFLQTPLTLVYPKFKGWLPIVTDVA